jgi:hypothetical protein
MDDLRQRLEKVLAEHQRENGDHIIGGREQLIQRLLNELGIVPQLSKPSDSGAGELNGACC